MPASSLVLDSLCMIVLTVWRLTEPNPSSTLQPTAAGGWKNVCSTSCGRKSRDPIQPIGASPTHLSRALFPRLARYGVTVACQSLSSGSRADRRFSPKAFPPSKLSV
ncbi:hypothetical protein POX_c04501 [Penicillium oxalicum]|uniref:Secreted protein n=1 Tax=Penicillium oxalicum (strain 114-2 / CGMCC 5302) TaxID=933388 RepID=S7Z7H4_PENO1|nr:hypothetical protein POX_c04501 [Penicillium oxalicum]EPS26119.1 hypothetical protein PDE_01055 [Penicillium oxalicum 114-2]KAI2791635.1 hypothetical protein POX_c04501 [Penicillium oxalicum]